MSQIIKKKKKEKKKDKGQKGEHKKILTHNALKPKRNANTAVANDPQGMISNMSSTYSVCNEDKHFKQDFTDQCIRTGHSPRKFKLQTSLESTISSQTIEYFNL